MGIKLGENGMIADDDKLYEELDRRHDSGEYEKIVSAVLEIPMERRSNKLWFRLISAYNNLKQYDKASGELQEIFPRCETPVDRARWNYMNGYIFDVNRKEIMARHFYEDALEADPDDTAELGLKKEIEDCGRYIEKDLQKLRELAEKITRDIKKRYAQMPWSEKYELNDEEFTMQLGFLPAIRKIPGQERGLGFTEYFRKYEGGQREQAREWLERLFGITDRGSFIEFFQTGRDCNIANLARDVIANLNGRLEFELSELNKNGRRMFDDVTLFIGTFAEYLPDAGAAAWDMCEKIGFLRHAYAVDYISDNDYRTCMTAIKDDARVNFSSTEEYMLSLAFGSGLYMFLMDDRSLSSALDFMLHTTAFLLQGDLADVRWKE